MKTENSGKDFIASVVEGINKEFGSGSAMMFNSLDLLSTVKGWVSTGSTLLDRAIGHGGIPAGRVTEIVGQISTGKSALGAHILANTQKQGGIAVLLDMEYAWDKKFASVLGVDDKQLITCQPDYLEQAFEITETLITIAKKEAPGRLVTIIWDTFSSIPTEKELEGDFADSLVGLHARRASQALRKLTRMIAKEKIVLIFISQLKQRITSMPFFGAEQETSIGGRAIGFHASVRIQMVRVGKVYNKKKKVIGIKCLAKVMKNKVAPPFGEARFEILFNSGIDEIGSLLDPMIEENIIKKKGGWCFYGDEKFQRGEWPDFYKAHPELKKQLKEAWINE